MTSARPGEARPRDGSPARLVLAASAGVAVVALAAQVAVPMRPVPMTLQTAAMFAVAMLGGARVAIAVALGYLAAAWLGAPVLSGGGSFAATGLLGARTAGYVLAFAPAAWGLGALSERRLLRGLVPMAVAAAGAHALVLAVGGAWLAAHVGARAAWLHGVAPFWLGALVKSAAVALVVAAWRRLRR